MCDYLIVVHTENDDRSNYLPTKVSAQKYKDVKKLLDKVIDVIKETRSWDDPLSEYRGRLEEYEIDAFYDYLPYYEEGDWIESIKVYPIQKEKTLL